MQGRADSISARGTIYLISLGFMKKQTVKKEKLVVDEKPVSGRCVYHINDLKEAKALLEGATKLYPNKKWYLSDFIAL